MHPPHGRTRGGPARRLKITPLFPSISVRRSAVRLHHPVGGDQTPGHRPTITRLSLAKSPLTVLSFDRLPEDAEGERPDDGRSGIGRAEAARRTGRPRGRAPEADPVRPVRHSGHLPRALTLRAVGRAAQRPWGRWIASSPRCREGLLESEGRPIVHKPAAEAWGCRVASSVGTSPPTCVTLRRVHAWLVCGRRVAGCDAVDRGEPWLRLDRLQQTRPGMARLRSSKGG